MSAEPEATAAMAEEPSGAIAGVKRPLEEPPAPEAPAPTPDITFAASDSTAPPEANGTAEAAAAVQTQAPMQPPVMPTGGPSPEAAEEAALQHEAAYLRQQNAALQTQLAHLQQQHQALSAAAAQAQAQSQAQPAPAPAPAPDVRHNPAWTEQVNPENGVTYYWNSSTGESTYTRPADFNPGATTTSSLNLPQTKGPPGANLFVVRKMRRGEYDEFNDADLHREFSKCAGAP